MNFGLVAFFIVYISSGILGKPRNKEERVYNLWTKKKKALVKSTYIIWMCVC